MQSKYKMTLAFILSPTRNMAAVLARLKRTGSYLDVDLVSTEDNGNVLTNTLQVSVPVGYVLVGDSGSNVEHDDTTLSYEVEEDRNQRHAMVNVELSLTLDVVTVSETSELLLTSGVPTVEDDGSVVGVEVKGVNLDTKSSYKRISGKVPKLVNKIEQNQSQTYRCTSSRTLPNITSTGMDKQAISKDPLSHLGRVLRVLVLTYRQVLHR
jgi:hypothetical protein